MFKANLEIFKKGCNTCSESNFWDVSRVLLEKIEGPSYLESKKKHNAYLIDNPFVISLHTNLRYMFFPVI